MRAGAGGTAQQRHPDVIFTEAFNFVEPVVENYDGSMALLYEGALLAVLVVFALPARPGAPPSSRPSPCRCRRFRPLR